MKTPDASSGQELASGKIIGFPWALGDIRRARGCQHTPTRSSQKLTTPTGVQKNCRGLTEARKGAQRSSQKITKAHKTRSSSRQRNRLAKH